MGEQETAIQKESQLIATEMGARLLRNNVGVGLFLPHGFKMCERCNNRLRKFGGMRRVRYGLATGSHDLVGWVPVDGVAVFASVEIKTEKGRASAAQRRWMKAVQQVGGIVGVARSVDDTVAIISDGIDRIRKGK